MKKNRFKLTTPIILALTLLIGFFSSCKKNEIEDVWNDKRSNHEQTQYPNYFTYQIIIHPNVVGDSLIVYRINDEYGYIDGYNVIEYSDRINVLTKFKLTRKHQEDKLPIEFNNEDNNVVFAYYNREKETDDSIKVEVLCTTTNQSVFLNLKLNKKNLIKFRGEGTIIRLETDIGSPFYY